MGKTKSANPAEAYRKAQRKKELAKNKEARKKTRELASVKKDTAPVEEEIRELEAQPCAFALDGKGKTRLSNLKAELDKLHKAKEEYVKEHPEHRKLVYGEASTKKSRGSDESGIKPAGGAVRQLFGKDGLPLHPERSIYYDPVLNPYGVPPPGMPYMEKPMPPDAMEENDDSEGSDDDDIAMPEGPAPDADTSDSDDSDDDIPMPPGPPPLRNVPPLPKGPLPPLHTLPPPSPIPLGVQPGVPPLPMEHPPPLGFIPPPPPGFAIPTPIPANLPSGAIPGPPMGLPPFPPNFPPPSPTNSRARIHNPRYRGPPPGVYDPMTPFTPQVLPPTPHSTSSLPPPPAHLPPRPSAAPPPPLPTSTTSVISAEPELRDFKKEATSFVPRQAKKFAKGNSRINATPDTGDSTPAEARPDLMKSLEEAGISIPKQQPAEVIQKKASSNVETKDDYDKFMDDMGDLLKQ